MPTSGWKVSIDLLGEDSRSSQGDVDMDPEFGECTLSHCVYIYIYTNHSVQEGIWMMKMMKWERGMQLP